MVQDVSQLLEIGLPLPGGVEDVSVVMQPKDRSTLVNSSNKSIRLEVEQVVQEARHLSCKCQLQQGFGSWPHI